MKTAFIIDVGDGSELERLKEALSLMGYPPQLVSSFGISLGNDEVTENAVSLPPPPRCRGRVAEKQEVVMVVRGVEVSYDSPDSRGRIQRGERNMICDEPIINVRLELQARAEGQQILTLMQRIQHGGIVGLYNVER